ncbi:MAG: DUF6470 family protein [Oscillospiraceae bacterium]|nr:DUF6470 family protein [Oscillospiraceae bacterium]
MQQLLEIHTTPLKYELHSERAHLEMNHAADAPVGQVEKQDAKLTQHTTPSKIYMDAYNMRKAFHMLNATDFARSAAEKGEEHIAELTQEYVDVGEQLSHIERNVSIGDIIRQKMAEQPSYYTVFLPNGGTEISWTPAQVDMEYQPSQCSYTWRMPDVKYDYVPGSVTFRITQQPRVEIRYLGGFNYFPPSANPNQSK